MKLADSHPQGSWKSIAEIAIVVRGVTYSKSDVITANSPNAIGLLRATNIEPGQIDYRDLVYIPESKVKARQRLQIGDILVASSSGSETVVGKNALISSDESATFGAFCTVIRPTSVEATYLSFALQSQSIRQLWSEKARGTNINNLKSGDISETRIWVPDRASQESIVLDLQNQFAVIEQIRSGIEHQIQKIESLRNSILYNTFSGNY